MADFTALGRQQAGVGVVSMHGQLDGAAEGALQDAWGVATATAPSAVVLDFGDVVYINSTGIALVVGLLARARAESRAVRASGLTPHYRHIFDITRLSDLMTIHASVEDAVGGTVTA
jgi:anti-anti-sigma factor